MKRTEPPPLARWMLEHCTPVDSDQAIAGDLLEDFYSGRSDGWYWHQALSACAIAWLNYLRQRILLLTFALLWSMLAPAWKMFSDRIEDSPIFASTGHNLVAPIAGFVVWTVLNSAFLWIGLAAGARACGRLNRSSISCDCRIENARGHFRPHKIVRTIARIREPRVLGCRHTGGRNNGEVRRSKAPSQTTIKRLFSRQEIFVPSRSAGPGLSAATAKLSSARFAI